MAFKSATKSAPKRVVKTKPTAPPKTAPKASNEPKTAQKKASTKLVVKKSGFAIFATGGKQYRVSAGDSLKIEKLQGEHGVGDKITFDKVLMTATETGAPTFGNPFIKGAEVKATLKKIARYKTVDVIKYKQKSRYFKKYGHRQPYFEVKIESIK